MTRSAVPEALVLTAPRGQAGRDCPKARRPPWRAVEICEAAFGIEAASEAATESGAQTAEGAAAGLMAAVVLV